MNDMLAFLCLNDSKSPVYIVMYKLTMPHTKLLAAVCGYVYMQPYQYKQVVAAQRLAMQCIELCLVALYAAAK